MAPVTPFVRRKTRWSIRIGLVILVALLVLVLCTSWPSDVLARPLTMSDSAQRVDAVIILGAGTQKGSDALPLQAKLRVQRGVAVSKQGEIPIIVSGGYSKHTRLYEAPLLADQAVRDGVGPSDILLESASRSTYENAKDSLAIVRQHVWTSIAVVTSEYHTWRACHVFRKQFSGSVRCVAAPSRDASHDTVMTRIGRFRGIVREYGAIAYYTVKGYL